MYSDRYYSALLTCGCYPITLANSLQMEKAWKQTGIEQPFQFQFTTTITTSCTKRGAGGQGAQPVFHRGLYHHLSGTVGAITQVTERRVKEIGIRKINGATVVEVIQLLNREFVIAVVVSFVIAALYLTT